MGIYVDVMLFDGFAIHLSPAPDNVEGHPFHAANNINGIGLDSINDYQVLPLDPRVRAIEKAYIRKVVDTVQDLPNVLYEVANESSGGGSVDSKFAEALGLGDPPSWGDSTHWQYWVIDLVKQYEKKMGYTKHPIGMTMQFPVPKQDKVNEPLFNGAADWISPGYDDEIFANGGNPMEPSSPASHWFEDPPAGDGRKVIITDTDHYSPGKGDALWAWKSFLRGHNPILMDFGIVDGVKPPDPLSGTPSYDSFESARYAMGDTLRYANKMNLIEMVPHGDLTLTGYALADPGKEYLVLQPDETPEPFTLKVEPGTYTVEWFHISTRETMASKNLKVDGAKTISFNAPFKTDGPAVLYLNNVTR